MNIELNRNTAKKILSTAGTAAEVIGAGTGLALGSELIKAVMPKELKWLGTVFWAGSILPASIAIVKRDEELRPYLDGAVDVFADDINKFFEKRKKAEATAETK